jgi:hypothetical protein
MFADTVCIDSSIGQQCLFNYPFFGIEYQQGLDGLAGIMGLGPSSSS